MSGVSASPKVAPYFVHRRSASQSSMTSDDFGSGAEGTPGYLVSTPSETNIFVGIGSDSEVVDMLPSGATADQFGPRMVMVSVGNKEFVFTVFSCCWAAFWFGDNIFAARRSHTN